MTRTCAAVPRSYWAGGAGTRSVGDGGRRRLPSQRRGPRGLSSARCLTGMEARASKGLSRGRREGGGTRTCFGVPKAPDVLQEGPRLVPGSERGLAFALRLAVAALRAAGGAPPDYPTAPADRAVRLLLSDAHAGREALLQDLAPGAAAWRTARRAVDPARRASGAVPDAGPFPCPLVASGGVRDRRLAADAARAGAEARGAVEAAQGAARCAWRAARRNDAAP